MAAAEASWTLAGARIYTAANTSLQDQLRSLVRVEHVRILDLFQEWDANGDGKVDRREFRKALSGLGVGRDQREEVHRLFDSFDHDSSGEVDYNELHKILRDRAAIDDSLLPGGAGLTVTDSKNDVPLRQESGSKRRASLVTSRLEPVSVKPMQEQLRAILKYHQARVIDLFKDWDEDGSKQIDREEFRKALASLGVGKQQQSEVYRLFDAFDRDKSGSLDYNELNEMLREHVAIDGSLLPGAAGVIAVEARNEIELRHGAGAKNRAMMDGAPLDSSGNLQVRWREAAGFRCYLF